MGETITEGPTMNWVSMSQVLLSVGNSCQTGRATVAPWEHINYNSPFLKYYLLFLGVLYQLLHSGFLSDIFELKYLF